MASKLTTSNAVVLAALNADPLEIRRGDTLSLTFTSLGVLTDYDDITFTVKRKLSDTDNNAMLQVSTSGLLRIMGAVGTSANGSITVSSLTDGDISISVKAVEMAKLTLADGCFFDVQVTIGDVVKTLTIGKANIIYDVTT